MGTLSSGSLFLSAGRGPQAGWVGARPPSPLRWESCPARIRLSHPGRGNVAHGGLGPPPLTPEPGGRLSCPLPAAPHSHPPVRTGSRSPRAGEERHPESADAPVSHGQGPQHWLRFGAVLVPQAGGPVPSLSSVDSGSAQPQIFTYRKPHSLLFASSFRQTPERFACALTPDGGQGEGPSPARSGKTRATYWELPASGALQDEGPWGWPDPPSLVPAAARLPDLGSHRQASPLLQLEGGPPPPPREVPAACAHHAGGLFPSYHLPGGQEEWVQGQGPSYF